MTEKPLTGRTGEGWDAPEPHTIGETQALGVQTLLVDLASPGTRNPYLPRGLYNMAIGLMEPHRHYNGILYLEHSPKMHPLRWSPCTR